MTPCEELRTRGSDLIDGECDEDVARKLNAHLNECPDCKPWFSSLQSTVGLLRNLPKSRPPDSLLEHIRQLTTRAK